MAYSLRYWYNNKLTDGKVIRLEIYKKDSAAAAMEIGDVVQGLSLNIDGGEDNIDAPIVSTSLVMTFCDAYDHPEAEVKKCGNYAEFYTPDATLWKVVLRCKDNGSSSFRTLWGGYVTPDSYEEDLTYRGSVTIVARDNIGHMADFPFDAKGDGYGTISFREIIEGAWAKIESPMSLVFHDEWMQTEGVSALDTRMNVTAFEDKSWHEAVEAVLYGYGAVLRFIGDNEVKVSPLRYMPNYGGSVTHSEPVFMTGATRMLTPAVKRIEETASYELEVGAVIPRLEASDYTGETGTYRCKIDGIEIDGETFSTNEHDAPIWPISTLGFNDWYNGALATTLFFNVDAYDVGYFSNYRGLSDEIKRYMYIAANQVDARFVRVYKAMQSSDFVIKMQFGKPVRLNREYELEQSYGSFNLKEITYAITMEQNGVTTYYHGGDYWSATRKELRISFDATKENSVAEFPVAIGQNIGDALFCFEIVKIEYAQVGPSNETYGLYACIQNLSFDVPENISLLQTNRVNTNYNEENNVIITRDTAIAPAYNTTFLPSVIKNGIFYAEGLAYKPAKAWAFAGDTPQQMAVYNHLQLLSYYAKPNNVIEGSIVNGDVSRFAHIWQFEGKEHILVSGRYNFINGYIEGAILREFARYENLWGSTGGTQLPATETSNETNVEASASSSSSANTYENTTTVSIGMGGGGSSYLRDLLDVDVSASVKGSILCYNGQQWVDKSLDVLLTEMLKLGDWFYKTEDGKSIGTKYNLFSEGEMSANSLNLGGGTSGGGGLIQNVLGKSAFGTVVSEDNATTFNAYAIDSLYKRIVELEGKDVDVDLSDYYTKQQTQNAITSALSPYIKATDADGKYAALASFNALQSSFDRLYSALNDDTSGVINTWNEVVDFVNEYSGSEDLSTILGKMNTDINARVKVSDFDTWKTDVFNPLSVTVTNLGNKVNDHTDKINKILSWFELREDEDLLITTHNLASYKEISANGISQGTGGGGSGLISSVLGVGSLGATLTNDNSVVFNAYATNEIYKATQGHASRIGVLESQVGQLTTQGTKVSVSDLLTTGTKIATITVDGVAHEVKGDFLPTSGGTLSFAKSSGLTLKRTDDTLNVLFFEGFVNGNSTLLGGIGMGSYNGPVYVTPTGFTKALLHSDNIGDYALQTYGTDMPSDIVNYVGYGKIDKDWKEYGPAITFGIANYYTQIQRKYNSNETYIRGYWEGKYSDWKTIAFTDSTVEAARRLVTEDNQDMVHLTTGTLFVGRESFGLTHILGDTITLRSGANATIGLRLNSSGNVTIGSSDLAGTGAKLYVDGDILLKAYTKIGAEYDNRKVTYNYIEFNSAVNGLRYYGGTWTSSKAEIAHQFIVHGSLSLALTIKNNGNVLIGTTTDSGYKLDVNGSFNATSGYINGNTLIHSGNIGDYAVKTKGDSTIVDGSLLFQGGYIRIFLPDGSFLGGFNVSSITGKPIFLTQDEGWKTIAFTDSNVASATKLETPRTIWGQSFDGTGNVSGNIYLGTGTIRSSKSGTDRTLIDFGSAGDPYFGYGTSSAGIDTHICGNNIFLQYGTSRTNALVINSSGHVTIGASDLAGTSWKTYINGSTRIANITITSSVLNANRNGNTGALFDSSKMGFEIEPFASYVTLKGYNTSGTGVGGINIASSGNVGIGTTNPQYKLDVNGNVAFGSAAGCDVWLKRTTGYNYINAAHSLAFTVNNDSTNIAATFGSDKKASFYGAVTMSSTLSVGGASTFNGIAYFGGTTYYINTSGNANFNAISGSSLQVDSAAFNGTIHSNEYSGSVAKWSITKDGAASFASLSNGGLLETSTLRVSSTSTFTGKTNHNGGIGATSLNVSGTSTLSGHVGIGTSPHSTYSLYVDGSLRCGPIDGGTASLGALHSNTHVPNFSETYNLGSDAYRWASIYGVGADFSGNVTVNGTLNADDIDGYDIYITASNNLYLDTPNGYLGAPTKMWAIDSYGNYKGQSLYINPRDNDNVTNPYDKNKGFPDEEVAVFVNGDIAATGEISANALNQGSDIRFKHQLGDITLDLDTIANAPMFRFTWTNKENSRVQIGTSAQYWKDSARELVSVDKDDFHRLDYATLGVLIGVTLGKTVKNHEDRIKELETKVESLEAENRRLRYGN